MALLKSISTDSGAKATYWKIPEVRQIHPDGAVHVVGLVMFSIEGFANAKARETNKTPLMSREHKIFLKDGESADTYTRTKCYGWLKKNDPDFEGAEDDK